MPGKEKVCECGSTRVKIGETISYKLKYVPAKIIKEKHIYYTYKCEECYKDDITNIVKAPYDLTFSKSMASSSLVANIITDKFVKYLPLYRQEKLFRNVGLDISRANMSSVAYTIVETALAKINMLITRESYCHIQMICLNI